MNRAAGFGLQIPCVCAQVLWAPGLHREAQEPLAVRSKELTDRSYSCSLLCLLLLKLHIMLYKRNGVAGQLLCFKFVAEF